MAQLPPDSQALTASQVAPSSTGGTYVPGLAPTRNTEGRAGATISFLTGHRPVSTPLTVDTTKVTSCVPVVPGISTTWRLMFIVGSWMRYARGGSGIRAVTSSIRIRVTTIFMPSVTGVDAGGTTLSPCSSGAPAAASNRPTFGAASRRSLGTPPSTICTFFALPAVHRHLQRPAALQHDGVGLMDRLIGGRIQLVVVVDGEAVFPHHVDHPRLHRRHRHR